MRRNPNKDIVNLPNSLATAIEAGVLITRAEDRNNIDERIYKGAKIEIEDSEDPYYGTEEYEVRYTLRRLYYNKCAYCECIEYKPDVEHYRPKKKVTGAQGNNHGYYWLCYEWTNLLPACTACNSKSGKWNKFPVLGVRCSAPPFSNDQIIDLVRCNASHNYLQSERPGLLHPEVDDPESFFGLSWEGYLTSLDGDTGRGFHTWTTCDLNRGNLIHARKSLIDDFSNRIREVFANFRNGQFITPTAFKEALQMRLAIIREKTDNSQPYSFVALFVWEHFSDFVENTLSDLALEEAEFLISCFQEFSQHIENESL